MNVTNINLQNFQSFYGEHRVVIPTGLVLVEGKNYDNEAAVSNRAGKTSLLNSISVALYGKSPLVSRTKNFVNSNAEWASVELIFDSGDKVQRWINHPNQGNSLFYNNSKFDQEVFEKKVNLNFDSFSATVFFGTNVSDFLEKVLRKPTEAKDLLTSLLPSLKIFDIAWEIVKNKITNLGEEISAIEKDIRYHEGLLDQINKYDYDSKIVEWERDKFDRLSSIKKYIDSLNENQKETLENLQLLEESLESLRKRKSKFNETVQYYSSIVHDLKAKLTSKFLELKSFEKDNKIIEEGICPMCGQKLPYDSNLIQDRQKTGLELRSLIVKMDEELKDIKEKYDISVAKLKEFDEKESKLYKKIKLAHEIESKIKEYQRIESESNPYVKLKQESQSKKSFYEDKIKSLNLSKEEIQDNLLYYNFWYKGFGSKGIKNFVFDDIVFRLTDFASEYLYYLTNGTISIEFSPRKEKKTGGFTETISLDIYNKNDHRDFFTWSQSERKKVSLAVDLAMNRLLSTLFNSPFEFLIFDEVFDGLDSVGIEVFCSLLKKQLDRVKTIFVVSHNPFSEQYFDNVITVIKEGGVSRVLNSGLTNVSKKRLSRNV